MLVVLRQLVKKLAVDDQVRTLSLSRHKGSGRTLLISDEAWFNKNCLILEDEIHRLRRNVGMELQLYSAFNPKRAQILFT
jgi:hypothetical protein